MWGTRWRRRRGVSMATLPSRLFFFPPFFWGGGGGGGSKPSRTFHGSSYNHRALYLLGDWCLSSSEADWCVYSMLFGVGLGTSVTFWYIFLGGGSFRHRLGLGCAGYTRREGSVPQSRWRYILRHARRCRLHGDSRRDLGRRHLPRRRNEAEQL